MGLIAGKMLWLTVNGTPAGSKNHLFDPIQDTVLKEIERATHIGIGIAQRVLHG
jgi:hypothetical protein